MQELNQFLRNLSIPQHFAEESILGLLVQGYAGWRTHVLDDAQPSYYFISFVVEAFHAGSKDDFLRHVCLDEVVQQRLGDDGEVE